MCSARNQRLEEKIAQEMVIHGGLLDPRGKNFWSEEKKYKIESYGQRWRGAYPLVYSFETLRKVHNIPVWFMRRYVKQITKHCVWEKSQSWGYGDDFAMIDEEDFKKLSSFVVGNVRTYIVGEMTLPEMISVSKYIYNTDENGVEWKAVVREKAKRVRVDFATDDIGIVINEVVCLWNTVSDRFLSIYGLDCKVCKKHKKNKSKITCLDLAKYKTDICEDCLKRHCDILNGLGVVEGIDRVQKKKRRAA